MADQSHAAVQSSCPREVTSSGVTGNFSYDSTEVCFNAVSLDRLPLGRVLGGCVCSPCATPHPSLEEATCISKPRCVSVLIHSWWRCRTAVLQSSTRMMQLGNAHRWAMQHLPRDLVEDSRHWQLYLPGWEAWETGFYLPRKVYLPFLSRLLLKWMENQRKEVRTIP